MILRYENKSFYETKNIFKKLGYFKYWSMKQIYFTQINAQQHFVYLIFQQNKILSNK